MTEFCYTHKVQYYETDMMQIVHHSNYIRWMEEGRLEFLAGVGLAYDKMEADGVLAPVLSADCCYRNAVRYGDTVKIYAKCESFDGIRFSLSYRILSEDGTILHATGSTTHAFVDKALRPINVKHTAPHIYDFFKDYKKERKKN